MRRCSTAVQQQFCGVQYSCSCVAYLPPNRSLLSAVWAGLSQCDASKKKSVRECDECVVRSQLDSFCLFRRAFHNCRILFFEQAAAPSIE